MCIPLADPGKVNVSRFCLNHISLLLSKTQPTMYSINNCQCNLICTWFWETLKYFPSKRRPNAWRCNSMNKACKVAIFVKLNVTHPDDECLMYFTAILIYKIAMHPFKSALYTVIGYLLGDKYCELIAILEMVQSWYCLEYTYLLEMIYSVYRLCLNTDSLATIKIT